MLKPTESRRHEDRPGGARRAFDRGRVKRFPRAGAARRDPDRLREGCAPYPAGTNACSDSRSPEEANIATVREELLKLGEFCFSRRESLRGHLADVCLHGLLRNSRRIIVTDGLDG